MRSEIKIPINNNFELYFDNWVNFKSKIQKQYDDRLITSIYYDSENFLLRKTILLEYLIDASIESGGTMINPKILIMK